jgi:serine/threonine protein kinase
VIQEWVPGGELFHHLDLEGAFDEPTSMFFAANVVLALDFLHKKVGIMLAMKDAPSC